MKLSLGISLAASVQLAAAQFLGSYFPDDHCNERGLQGNLVAYECCEAPPSPSTFRSVRVTTGGVYGIVVFTYINSNQSCGSCQFGGILNKCYDNHTPFNIGYVAPVRVCGNVSRHRRALDSLAGTMEKQSLADNTGGRPECKNSRRPNIAFHDGNKYDITGLTEPELNDLVVDLKNGDGSQFHSKWFHIHIGQVAESAAAAVDAPSAKE